MQAVIPLRVAADVMTRRVLCFEPEDDLLAAARLLARHGWSGAPVIDARGAPIGMLSEADVVKALIQAAYDHHPLARTVGDAMHVGADCVTPHTDIFEIAQRFRTGTHRRFPVVDHGRIVGLVTRRDLMAALEAVYAQQRPRHRPPSLEERLRDLTALLRGT